MSNIGAGQKLFGRGIRCVIGVPDNPALSIEADFNDQNAYGLDVSGLDIEFIADKSLLPTPNNALVRIYNLHKYKRTDLAKVQKLTLSLSVGYQSALHTIYLGETRAAYTTRHGPDYVTHIESADGEKELATSRLIQPLGARISASTAMTAIVKALGVGTGNLNKAIQALESSGITQINGASLTGSAKDRMTDLCRSAGLEWSIQDGAVQIIDIGAIVTGTDTAFTGAYNINSDTGMIGSPTMDNQGVVTVTTLIIPGIFPGVQINLASEQFTGAYRVQRCRWHGQTWGNDWFLTMDCVQSGRVLAKPLGTQHIPKRG